ncbi:MAG TPA: HAMP domain-containing protein, partial [Myxococcota bacterium]|nr:HAMP domain-containing protein [Myxococcota bacterium]
MTLKRKLLLAQAPLLLCIAIIGGVAHMANTVLAQSSQRILQDNYRSVLAAQRMKEYLERANSGLMFIVAGQPARGIAQVAEFEARFDQELRIQESNITEPGEQAATAALRSTWDAYRNLLHARQPLPPSEPADVVYFRDLLPAFQGVKDRADVVLYINQDAMVHKSDEAERVAQRHRGLIVLVAVCGCVAGFLASSAAMGRLLRPLSVLGQAVRRFGQGDLGIRAQVGGQDEIAILGHEFNTMAGRLQEYRNSSLGELLEAQQAAQAVIESLPDPILVVHQDGQITHANHAAQQLFAMADTPARNLDALTNDAALTERLTRVFRHTATGHGPYQPRGFDDAIRVSSSDGERYLLPRSMPLHSALGAVSGSTLVLQDVTRLRRIDELKNDLVATVAHEFRTPLTSLRLAIHM